MRAVYLVFCKLKEPKIIEVGAKGKIEFEKGIYVYVGSAMNSVEKRLGRHFSETDKKHWHIDYFTAESEQIDYFILPETGDYECEMAKIVQESADPIEGFGASDCGCSTHLFKIR